MTSGLATVVVVVVLLDAPIPIPVSSTAPPSTLSRMTRPPLPLGAGVGASWVGRGGKTIWSLLVLMLMVPRFSLYVAPVVGRSAVTIRRLVTAG